MNETLNVSGALLVKLFGRQPDESRRFAERAAGLRDVGIRQALIGRWFFLGIGLVSSIGTALVFWTGGYLVLSDALTIGTVVAFGAYLTQLYGPIAALTNARVELVTSLVSFERVFEVLDLPQEIEERPDAVELDRVRARFASTMSRSAIERRASGWSSRRPALGLARSGRGASAQRGGPRQPHPQPAARREYRLRRHPLHAGEGSRLAGRTIP